MTQPESSGSSGGARAGAPGAGLDARGLPAGYPFRPEWEVTPRRVKTVLDSGETKGPDGVLVVDCRRPDEYAVARVAGMVLVPMEEIGGRLGELEGETLGRDRPIIVMCHHGRRSLRVTEALRGAGFTDVKSMAGGIDLWSLDIDPSVPRY